MPHKSLGEVVGWKLNGESWGTTSKSDFRVNHMHRMGGVQESTQSKGFTVVEFLGAANQVEMFAEALQEF